jgi:hypothetical protein
MISEFTGNGADIIVEPPPKFYMAYPNPLRPI